MRKLCPLKRGQIKIRLPARLKNLAVTKKSTSESGCNIVLSSRESTMVLNNSIDSSSLLANILDLYVLV